MNILERTILRPPFKHCEEYLLVYNSVYYASVPEPILKQHVFNKYKPQPFSAYIP